MEIRPPFNESIPDNTPLKSAGCKQVLTGGRFFSLNSRFLGKHILYMVGRAMIRRWQHILSDEEIT